MTKKKKEPRTLKGFSVQAKENYSNLCNFAALLILEDVAIIRFPFMRKLNKVISVTLRELTLSAKPLFPQGANNGPTWIEKPLLSSIFRIAT